MAFLGHVSPEILPSSWLSALSCKDLATLEMASASGLRDLKAHRTGTPQKGNFGRKQLHYKANKNR